MDQIQEPSLVEHSEESAIQFVGDGSTDLFNMNIHLMAFLGILCKTILLPLQIILLRGFDTVKNGIVPLFIDQKLLNLIHGQNRILILDQLLQCRLQCLDQLALLVILGHQGIQSHQLLIVLGILFRDRCGGTEFRNSSLDTAGVHIALIIPGRSTQRMYSQILVHVLFLHRQSIQQCHQRIDFLRLNLTADLVNSCLQCLGGNFALFVHQFRNGRAIFGAFQQFIDLCLGIGNDPIGASRSV